MSRARRGATAVGGGGTVRVLCGGYPRAGGTGGDQRLAVLLPQPRARAVGRGGRGAAARDFSGVAAAGGPVWVRGRNAWATRLDPGRTHHDHPFRRHHCFLFRRPMPVAARFAGRPHDQPPGGRPPQGHHQLHVHLRLHPRQLANESPRRDSFSSWGGPTGGSSGGTGGSSDGGGSGGGGGGGDRTPPVHLALFR